MAAATWTTARPNRSRRWHPAVTRILWTALLVGSPAYAFEVGVNDFRITHVGPDGDIHYDALAPRICRNPALDQFLVVWNGNESTPGLSRFETEIFGQRLSADGKALGDEIRISQMGPPSATGFFAKEPDLAFDPVRGRYLVVWAGFDGTSIADDEWEIFGQLLDGATGAEIGSDTRLSQMGPEDDDNYEAKAPAIAYGATADEFLVVWQGETNQGGLIDNEFEIWGQRVSASSGFGIGSDFRISEALPDGNHRVDAQRPDVVFLPGWNQYLVVWEENVTPDGPTAIMGQWLAGEDASKMGAPFRITLQSEASEEAVWGHNPAVAYDTETQSALVVSFAHFPESTLQPEYEIFGRRIDPLTGTTAGPIVQLSITGANNEVDLDAVSPRLEAVAGGEYLVAWHADGNAPGLVNDEYEIYARQIDAATLAFRSPTTRVSSMGPDGDPDAVANSASLAVDEQRGRALVVWQGNEDASSSSVDKEYEVYGQLVGVPCLDDDQDGYGAAGSHGCPAAGIDCDDTTAAVSPGAAEILANGIDDDCNAATPDCVDADTDGYSVSGGVCGAVDCLDTNAQVNPGKAEVPGNGLDDDCNAATSDCKDLDADGYGNPASAACAHPEADCNDSNASVNPGRTEIPSNGIDDDCNAATPGGCSAP